MQKLRFLALLLLTITVLCSSALSQSNDVLETLGIKPIKVANWRFETKESRDTAPTTGNGQDLLLTADQFFAGDGSPLANPKWASTSAGPFIDAFVSGNNVNFAKINGTGTGGSITLAAVNALENFTITSASGTISNVGNGVVPINVASGKTLDFSTQAFTSSATAGYNFSGPGVLALLGNIYQGGFTINSGTIVARGVNAMGGGAGSNRLTINGGTIAVSAARDFSGKYPGGIAVGGNFQLGESSTNVPISQSGADITFSNNVTLGTTTRTVTIGADGSYTFGGVISGSPGTGLTVTKASTATGALNLSGVNNYTGPTTILSGNLSLVGAGSIANSSAIEIGSGGIFDLTTASASMTLAPGQKLRGIGTATSGTIALSGAKNLTTSGTSPIEFSAFSGSTAPLTVSGAGTLALQAGDPVTVTISHGNIPLTPGDYKLIAKGATGKVTGTPASLTINGDGVSGTPSLVNIGNELFLRVIAANNGAVDFDHSSYSPGENAGLASVTLQRTGGSAGAVSVQASVANGTATGGGVCGAGTGVDFVNSGSPFAVNFADGQTTASFNIPICDDSLFEPSGPETVSLSLANPTGGATIGPQSTAVMNIIDNDVQPSVQLSSSTYSTSENSVSATITVQRTNATENAVSVNYNTSDITAANGLCGAFSGHDYVATSGTVNFASGETSKTVDVPICNDSLFESTETFFFAINSPLGATLGATNQATVSINEDDTAPTVQFSTATVTAGENVGTLTFVVNRSGATENAFTVNFATADGTAVNGPCNTGDYNSNSGSLSFAGGDPSKTFDVAICDDAAVESTETFSASLSSPSTPAVVGPISVETISIADNDAPPPATLIVTTTADSDDGSCTAALCSLRDAIIAANSFPDANTITFSIPGSGVQTIAPTSVLPVITSPITIDGYSQPGASANSLSVGDDAVLLIELSGENLGFPAKGLEIQASNCSIRGLVVNRFPFVNILIAAGTGNTISGNFIGLDPTGTTRRFNTAQGVTIAADGNLVGGTTIAARNVIAGNNAAQVSLSASGNTVSGNYIGTNAAGTARPVDGSPGPGIQIFGSSNTIGGATELERNVISGNESNGISIGGFTATPSSFNSIINNYIGVDAGGTTRVANDGQGILLQGGVTNTTIGQPGLGNVISGNGLDFGSRIFCGVAVRKDGSGTPSSTFIKGNFVGTNAAGTGAIGNRDSGIELTDSPGNTVGGAGLGEGNVISGNLRRGLFIQAPSASGNTVKGNLIGVGADGILPIGNGDIGGVFVSATAAGNTIGGTQVGEGNTVANNVGPGIRIDEFGGGNTFAGNSIFNNGGLGIDLDVAGVSSNDPGDPDVNAGGDPIQNFPVITNITTAGPSATITGALNSTPGQTFAVDFYANTSCDPSNFGEGRSYLGRQTTAATDGNGDVSFSFTPGSIPAGSGFFTATATSGGISTSEFSQCAQITSPATVQFSSAVFSSPEGSVATITVTRTGSNLTGSSSVHYATVPGGTATAGSDCLTIGNDYVPTTGTLNFGSNETSKTFNLTLCSDLTTESPAETVNLALSDATSATLDGQSTAVVKILDAATQFRSPQTIILFGNSIGSLYPSTLNVTGFPTPMGGVRVTLFGVSHPNPDGLEVLLVSPNGSAYVLMADTGGSNPLSNATITLQDVGAAYLPDSGAILDGFNYHPASCGTTGPFESPAPSIFISPGCGPTGPQMSTTFRAPTGDGTWTLYVRDDGTAAFGSPVGQITGWGLQLLVPTAARVGLGGRVHTPVGVGVANVRVTVSGGDLAQPLTATTNSFGCYNVSGLTAGQAYVVSVSSRHYRFEQPVRAVQLLDDVSGFDFVAEQ
ncbi:MAG: Calx-beta domain-containing protein [Acidobacteriota bacterium]